MGGTDTPVFADIQDSPVFEPIVRPDAIDVIYLLASLKLAAQVLLHDPSVFQTSSPINRDSPVFADIFDPLGFGIAVLRAVLSTRFPRWRDLEFFATLQTSNDHTTVVMGLLADDGCEPGRFALVDGCFGEAGS